MKLKFETHQFPFIPRFMGGMVAGRARLRRALLPPARAHWGVWGDFSHSAIFCLQSALSV